MDKQRPKASDISDDAFLLAVVEAGERRGRDVADRWAVGWVLSGHAGLPTFTASDPPLLYPEKVVLAKARSLIRRKAIRGCGCGCRGDFEIAPS